ncbi:hypothetical protein J3D54_001008 [Pseudomonas sp. GGS8]|uniref:hypothetical protein n=1 Tax=Pseudomonas sp. GGS8 TaxID=2817892 RepID=UPI00209D8C4F|nr:hypothetical protein [Pseudomonas sp. GGS8]
MNNQVVSERYISECIQSLREYDIGDMTIHPRSMFSVGDNVDEPSKASIVGEGVLSFSAGLSGENRSDAQNAYLYATLAANKAFPQDFQGKEWYALFKEVMSRAGWSSTSLYYNDLNVSGTSVRMDKLVLEILGSVVAGVALPGPTTALMLKVAGDAISALQKRDTALTAYERNLLAHGVGGIAAGACTENNGVATMALGAVRFLRRNTSTKVLFVDVDTRDVKLYRGEAVFEKNDLLAKATREVIATRLIEHAGKITDYDI